MPHIFIDTSHGSVEYVSLVPPGGTYNVGTAVTVTVHTASGYSFQRAHFSVPVNEVGRPVKTMDIARPHFSFEMPASNVTMYLYTYATPTGNKHVAISGEDAYMPYEVYIGNGAEWVRYEAYVGDGTSWKPMQE